MQYRDHGFKRSRGSGIIVLGRSIDAFHLGSLIGCRSSPTHKVRA